jgi:O-antigen ligase
MAHPFRFNRKTAHEYITVILLAGIILTLPLSTILNSILILLLGVNWFIEGDFKQKFNRIKHNILFYLPVSFYLLHLIGYLYSSNQTVAAFDLERKLSFIAFPILIGTIQISLTNCKILLNFHVITCIFISLVCFIFNFELYTSFTNTDISNHGFRNALTHPFNLHHVYMSMYIILAIFINLAFIINYFTSSLLAKIYHTASTLFLIYIVSILSARTPLLAFLITSVCVVIIIIVVNKKYILGIVAALGVIVFMTIMNYSPRLNYLYRLSENTSIDYHNIEGYYWSGGLNLKIALWNSALQTFIRNNWLFGVGIGDIPYEMQKTYNLLDFRFASQYSFDAHNQYLETTMGLGLLGLLSLLSQFAIPLARSFKIGHYLYSSFIIFFFICIFTECTLNIQKGIVFFCLFNALFSFQMVEKKPLK